MSIKDIDSWVINLSDRKDRLTEFYSQAFPFEVKRFEAIKHNPGIVGCNLSHHEILKQATKFPFIIFEDDCKMIEQWDVLYNAMKQLPKDWDMLYLGANCHEPIKKVSENLCRIVQGKCTHAIMYNSQRVVDYILRELHKPETIIDGFYCSDVCYKFNCYITYPMMAVQRAGESDIVDGYRDYENLLRTNFNKYVI